MIRVARDEAIAADAIVGVHSLDDVDGEGQPRDPRPSGVAIGQVERSGGRVANACAFAPGAGEENRREGLRRP